MTAKPLAERYAVVWRRNADGQVRKHLVNAPFVDDHAGTGEDTSFYWTDGNGACDCEIARHFAVAGEDDEMPCGVSAFTLLGFEFPDGTVRKP